MTTLELDLKSVEKVRTEIWTDITIQLYVPSEDGRIKTELINEPSKHEHRYRRMFCAVYSSCLVGPFPSCCPFCCRCEHGVTPRSLEPCGPYSILHVQSKIENVPRAIKGEKSRQA